MTRGVAPRAAEARVRPEVLHPNASGALTADSHANGTSAVPSVATACPIDQREDPMMKTRHVLKPTLSDNALEQRLDLAAMVGTVRTAVIEPPGIVFHSPIGNLPIGGVRGPLL